MKQYVQSKMSINIISILLVIVQFKICGPLSSFETLFLVVIYRNWEPLACGRHGPGQRGRPPLFYNFLFFNYKKFPILSLQIKNKKKSQAWCFLTCLLLSDLSRIFFFLWLLLGMRCMFKLASFYTAVWHRHQANHLFHANFRIARPHNVCVAFGGGWIKG